MSPERIKAWLADRSFEILLEHLHFCIFWFQVFLGWIWKSKVLSTVHKLYVDMQNLGFEFIFVLASWVAGVKNKVYEVQNISNCHWLFSVLTVMTFLYRIRNKISHYSEQTCCSHIWTSWCHYLLLLSLSTSQFNTCPDFLQEQTGPALSRLI